MTDQHQPVRLFLVEDHTMMRGVLCDYLAAIPGFVVCGEAADAEDALARLDEAEPDLVLVDTSLGHGSGIDLVGRILERRPELPCVMVSGHAGRGYVDKALSAGARGYVLKGDPGEMTVAIREVQSGSTYLSPRLQRVADAPG